MINKHGIKHYNNCKFLENFFRLDFGYNQYSTSSIFMIFLKKLFKEIFSTHILQLKKLNDEVNNLKSLIQKQGICFHRIVFILGLD